MVPPHGTGAATSTSPCPRLLPTAMWTSPPRSRTGVATSSSPFQSLAQGDVDIAAPKTMPKGDSVKMRPLPDTPGAMNAFSKK